jgi:hypothetical protein
MDVRRKKYSLIFTIFSSVKQLDSFLSMSFLRVVSQFLDKYLIDNMVIFIDRSDKKCTFSYENITDGVFNSFVGYI